MRDERLTTIRATDCGADGDHWRSVATYQRGTMGQALRRDTDFSQLRTWEYDALGRPHRSDVFSGGVRKLSRAYTFYEDGNVRTVGGFTVGSSAPSPLAPFLATFSYDGLDRIKSAQGPLSYRGSFRYDRAGNITAADVQGSQSDRRVQYAYGETDPQAVDALLNVTDIDSLVDASAAGNAAIAEFAYDAGGNMSRRIVGGELWNMQWTPRQMMAESKGPGGYHEVYLYNGAERIAALSSSNEYVRVWVGESELRFTPTGAEVKRIVRIGDAGGTLATVTTEAASGQSSVSLMYNDALHNNMLSVDDGGHVTSGFLYSAFGEVLEAFGPEADEERDQFNGKTKDRTGLSYYGYRYYDALAMRWTAMDPLFLNAPEVGLTGPQELNLYQFSLNNPVKFYDADGRIADVALGHKYEQGSKGGPGLLKVAAAIKDAVVSGVVEIGERLGTAAGAAYSGHWIRAGDEMGKAARAVAVEASIAAVGGPVAKQVAKAAAKVAGQVGKVLRKSVGLADEAGCFVAGTAVATTAGALAIENLNVGDRVMTDTGETTPTPEGWLRIELVMSDPSSPGKYRDIVVLRPAQWVEVTGAQVGKSILFRIDEMDVEGPAVVVAIVPGTVEDGPGRIVTGTFSTVASDVYWVKLEGDSNPIGVTSTHPLFSADRGDFVRVDELAEGELLRTARGVIRIESIAAANVSERVYNLEVETDHVYYAAEAEVFAHNGCGGVAGGGASDTAKRVTNPKHHSKSASPEPPYARWTLRVNSSNGSTPLPM